MQSSIGNPSVSITLSNIKNLENKSKVIPNSNSLMKRHEEPKSLIDPSRAKAVNCAGRLVLEITSNLMEVSKSQLLNNSRSKAHICVARQCAMYLLHTSFSINYCEVAQFFGRDRTTVSHACRVIEDLRDNEMFEEKLSRLEILADAAKKLHPLQSTEEL